MKQALQIIQEVKGKDTQQVYVSEVEKALEETFRTALVPFESEKSKVLKEPQQEEVLNEAENEEDVDTQNDSVLVTKEEIYEGIYGIIIDLDIITQQDDLSIDDDLGKSLLDSMLNEIYELFNDIDTMSLIPIEFQAHDKQPSRLEGNVQVKEVEWLFWQKNLSCNEASWLSIHPLVICANI